MTANERRATRFLEGEKQQLLHDAHDHLRACGNAQLAEQPMQVCVNRVLRNAEPHGKGPLGEIVKHAAGDFQFARRELQRTRNLSPRNVTKQSSAERRTSAESPP